MSKSHLGHELPKNQLTTVDDEVLTQGPSEILSKTQRDRDSVIPFAKDMVDNVVSGALSILDISRREGKPWKEVMSATKSPSDLICSPNIRSMDEDSADSLLEKNQISSSLPSADAQRPVFQVMHLRVSEEMVCDSAHAEQVAKIVKGLQDIQIGDSAYVLPADGSNIEKQVKRAVRNINSLEFGDLETAQLIICDGQGDVDAAILEAEVGPPSSAINSKPQHDASKISTCVLHKMIEELEVNDSTPGTLPEHGNKEGIANWEESEEKFVRIIEGPGEERVSGLESQEYHHDMILDQEPAVLGEENDVVTNKNFQDSLGQNQRVFSETELIDDRENGNGSRDCLDNYTDEESYWCTAGLITRVVTSQHGEIVPKKTMVAVKESASRASGPEGNLQGRRTAVSTQESLSVVEFTEEKHGTEDKESKLKGRKKTSFGKRLRKFFSRFKRTRDC